MPSADQQFAADLEAWGPQRTGPPPTLAAAEAYCRNLARRHYENFPLASWMLPHRLHQHFFNVYAYCRWADDLGDEVGDRERSSQLLAWWRDQLDACYGGSAVHPVFVALRTTIERFAIPREPFADLISAFEQDQHVREYETFAQLADYAAAAPIRSAASCFTSANASTSRMRASPTRSARGCSWRTSGKTWPAITTSAVSTCHDKLVRGSAIRTTICATAARTTRFLPSCSSRSRGLAITFSAGCRWCKYYRVDCRSISSFLP